MKTTLALLAAFVLFGALLASPIQADPAPDSCRERRMVRAIGHHAYAETKECLTDAYVEASSQSSTNTTWRYGAHPHTVCTVLVWFTAGELRWIGAPCHHGQRPQTPMPSDCSLLNLTSEARLDLCGTTDLTSQMMLKPALPDGIQIGFQVCGGDLTTRFGASTANQASTCKAPPTPQLLQILTGLIQDLCANDQCNVDIDPLLQTINDLIDQLIGTVDPNDLVDLLLAAIHNVCPTLTQQNPTRVCGHPVPDAVPIVNGVVQTLLGIVNGLLPIITGLCNPLLSNDVQGNPKVCGATVPVSTLNGLVQTVINLGNALIATVWALNPCKDVTGPVAPTMSSTQDPTLCGQTIPVNSLVNTVLGTVNTVVTLVTGLCPQPVANDGSGMYYVCGRATVNPAKELEDVQRLANGAIADALALANNLVALLVSLNPCRDEIQTSSVEDPQLCGQTVPVSTVVQTAASIVGIAESCLGRDVDGSNAPSGISLDCSALWGSRTISVPALCGVSDTDGDGVPVARVCTHPVTIDPKTGGTSNGPDNIAAQAGDPDDGNPDNPIPSIEPHVTPHLSIDPRCGGAYTVGADITIDGTNTINAGGTGAGTSGTINCPLPFTTPSYPASAVLGADGDGDHIPSGIQVFWQSTTIDEGGHASQKPAGITSVDLDSDDGHPYGPGGRAINPVPRDWDSWSQEWADRIGQAIQKADDLDQDGLKNIEEFRWDTVPVCAPHFENCMDHERDPETGAGGDNWYDGDEVHYWDDESNNQLNPNAPDLGLQDRDRLADADGDGIRNLDDADSDGDGILDGDEIHVYGTYPELMDSDCDATATACTPSSAVTNQYQARAGSPGTGDNIPDKSEVLAWNRLGGGRWSQDADGDGIKNLLDGDSDSDTLPDGDEFTLGRGQVRPDLLDTDNDAWNDGDETAWYVDTDGDGWINAADADADADGMPDGWEVANLLTPLSDDAGLDADSDRLTNLQEYRYGIPNGWSVAANGPWWGGTLPQDPDTDDDELQDGAEVLDHNTFPLTWDTDTDGLPDAWEARYDFVSGPDVTDPRDYSDVGIDPDADSTTASWCNNAGHSYTNQAEYSYAKPGGWSSAPSSRGGQGVWWNGTNPGNRDTDGDGVPDGYEVCTGTNPTQADIATGDDADQDGLTNGQEVTWNTDLHDADTDGDGLCDGGNAPACPTAGASTVDGEVKGWPILAGTTSRVVTSSPTRIDTDSDGLTDDEEHAGGTDPSRADTDGDGTDDAHEGSLTGGSTPDPGHLESSDPNNPDSDGDGLTDGQERQTYETDALDTDSDLDGISDGQEIGQYNTNPLSADSDDDYISDGEEVGVAAGGMATFTDPTNPDSDHDGLLDGDEAYFYGLDPNNSDSDCDGVSDGSDPDPFQSNTPPSTPGCTVGPSSPLDGYILYSGNGTITVLMRPPSSETPIEVMDIIIKLTGRVRTSSGLVAMPAYMSAEIQPLPKPETVNGNTYTHGIRLMLPEGMVDATTAAWTLTIMDQHLNSAIYSGYTNQISMHEVSYQDDPVPHGSGDDAWVVQRQTITDDTGAKPASNSNVQLADLPSGASSSEPQVWVQHIVQPAVPTFVGSVIDDDFRLVDGSAGGQAFGTVVYVNATAPMDAGDPMMHAASAGCCGFYVGSVKTLGYGLTSMFRGYVDSQFQNMAVRNAANQEIERASIGVLDQANDPRDPWWFTVRLSLDILAIGDVMDIYHGYQDHDNLLLFMGLIGLAANFSPLEGEADQAKVAFRAARASGATDEIIVPLARDLAKWSDEGADEMVREYARLIERSSKEGPDAVKGLGLLRRIEDPAVTVARDPKANHVIIDFLGQQVVKNGDAAAEAMARTFLAADSKVTLETAARVWTKFGRQAPDYVNIADDLALLSKSNGIDGVARSAAKMAPAQAKGHAYTIAKAAADVRAGKAVDLGFSSDVFIKLPWEKTGKIRKIFVDQKFERAGKQVFRDYKNYDGVVTASDFIRTQLYKYAKLVENLGGSAFAEAEWFIKNGQVSQSVKELASELGVKLYDDLGRAIN